MSSKITLAGGLKAAGWIVLSVVGLTAFGLVSEALEDEMAWLLFMGAVLVLMLGWLWYWLATDLSEPE